MRKTKTVAVMVLLAGLFLWGCGDNQSGDSEMEVEAAEEMTAEVEVGKDGSITETLVEDFAEDYYDEESLRTMILSESAEFTRNHAGEKVSVDKLEQKDGVVTLQISYSSAEVYSEYNTDEYNSKNLFWGTVKEAYDAGYSLDVSLQDVKGENTIGRQELLEMGEQYILISENPMQVKVPGKIQYASSNVTVSGKSEARFSGDEAASDKYYIIYK